MLVRVNGQLGPGVTAKDIALAIIGHLGTAGATGYVIEYAGDAITSLNMAGRMTVCNMSIEAGARAGMIAPDHRSEEHTSELQSLMRTSYAVFCFTKKNIQWYITNHYI